LTTQPSQSNETLRRKRSETETKRTAVKFALEITIETLRERVADSMANEPVLDQLYAAIQPDGTIHL
jgi:hypothetical protein